MKMFRICSVMILSCSALLGADWLTDGANQFRTAWQQDETIISKQNVGQMELLWRTKLDNEPRQMHSLFPPLIAGRVNTANGPKQIALIAGSSDNLYAIDVETGKTIWTKHFEYTLDDSTRRARTYVLCPGGITATPTLGPGAAADEYIVYAASWDGRLHRLNLADGKDVKPPAQFMPAHGKPYALSLVGNVLYTHTAQRCGGHQDYVYAYDLATDKVGSWGPAGGGMWGRTGPAISKEGILFTGTGDGPWDPENGVYANGIIGVQQDTDSKEMILVDYYGPSNAEWLYKRDLDMQVTPAIFDYNGKELMVDAGKECRIYLMDVESIGGDDHETPIHRTPLICNERVDFQSAGVWGAMASWVDSDGTRYVLTPFWGEKHSEFKAPIEHGEVVDGAVAAFTVEHEGDKYWLEPAWISRDMNRAEPPIVANGIVFAYGSGENTTQALYDVGLYNTAEWRVANSTRSRRSITSAASRWLTAASTSPPTTVTSIASASSSNA